MTLFPEILFIYLCSAHSIVITSIRNVRCVPSPDVIDIKATSYKKVSTFLRHIHSLGLLTLQEKGGVSAVVAVQRQHDLYRGVKVDHPEEFRSHVLGTPSESEGSSARKSLGTGKIKVVELYKMSKPVRELFGTVRGQYGECLKQSEVRTLSLWVLIFICTSIFVVCC